MRPNSLAIVFAAGLVLASWQPPAYARPHTCSEITKGDKKACQREAAAACGAIKRTPERMRCEDRLFQKHYACWNGAFSKACKPVEKKYWDVCRKAHELDTNRLESIQRFVARARAYDATLAEYAAYHKEWAVCFGDDRACQSTTSWLSHCSGAKDKYRRTFASAVDHILRADVAQARSHIAKTRRRGRNKFAISQAKSALDKVKMLEGVAMAVPWLAHRAADLARAKRALRGAQAGAEKDLMAALAKRRCPRGRAPNAKLARVLLPAAKRFFHSTSSTRVRVRALRLDGRKTRQLDRYRRIEIQSVPAFVCTERRTLRPRLGKPKCGYFEVTLRRRRPFGGKWGQWQVSVGRQRDLLCEHVR